MSATTVFAGAPSIQDDRNANKAGDGFLGDDHDFTGVSGFLEPIEDFCTDTNFGPSPDITIPTEVSRPGR